MEKKHLKIKITDLKDFPHNPKKHDIKTIERSIKELGFIDDVVCDETNTILSGHGRVEALKKLGEKEVDAIQITGWTDEQKKKYLLTANQSVILGGFDNEELKLFDKEELEFAGFDMDLFIEPDEKDDQVPEVPKIAKSKLGDLYELGNHKVLCGDSTKREDVEKLMGGRKADLFITDPPYGVSYGDKNKFLNAISRGNRIQENLQNDTNSIDEMSELWVKVFTEAKEVSKGGASYYIFSPQGGELMMMMMMMIAKSGWLLKHSIIWVKQQFVLGRSDYHYRHEPILYGWKDGGHQFYGAKGENSVWEFNKPHQSKLHPTMKPVEILEKIITNSSKQEDNVLDLFLGSGSTLIACEKTNRVCYGVEIDPQYIDVIVSRYCQFTGNNKIKLNGNEITWET